MKDVSMEEILRNRRPLGVRKFAFWKRWVVWLSDKNVTPNMVSCAGLFAGLASGVFLASTACVAPGPAQRFLWVLAVVCILLRGAGNLLDGILALETGAASQTGALWNEVPDRISDAATLIGAGYAFGGSPIAGWTAALVAVFVAYVRVQNVVAGAPQDYCGPMAKPARMLVIALVAIYTALTPAAWPELMSIALYTIVLGGLITAARRVRHAVAFLNSESS